MTRIYTRTGDKGETGLIGGRRVSKDDARVEAYGSLDEVNSAIGFARTLLADDAELGAALEQIQRDLFTLGAEIAAPGKEAEGPRVSGREVVALERLIDRFDAALAPLRVFILPGGTPAAAALHVARTTARRSERRVVTLARTEPVNSDILRYLNRLADLLFVLARTVNARAGAADPEWRPAKGEGR